MLKAGCNPEHKDICDEKKRACDEDSSSAACHYQEKCDREGCWGAGMPPGMLQVSEKRTLKADEARGCTHAAVCAAKSKVCKEGPADDLLIQAACHYKDKCVGDGCPWDAA